MTLFLIVITIFPSASLLPFGTKFHAYTHDQGRGHPLSLSLSVCLSLCLCLCLSLSLSLSLVFGRARRTLLHFDGASDKQLMTPYAFEIEVIAHALF